MGGVGLGGGDQKCTAGLSGSDPWPTGTDQCYFLLLLVQNLYNCNLLVMLLLAVKPRDHYITKKKKKKKVKLNIYGLTKIPPL
jgi:hypothetical protein